MFGDMKGAYDENGQRYAVELDKRGVVTETDKLEQMGGYFLDENNEKTNKSSKNIWLPQTGAIYAHGLNDEYQKWCKANGKTPNVGNNHPTVKPVELMKYLIKLVTPPGGTVLDPFNGSGSTGMAAVELGHPYIGCELDPAYVEIAEKRIAAWINRDQPKPVANNFEELFSATE
jgi:DNA modification methylase